MMREGDGRWSRAHSPSEPPPAAALDGVAASFDGVVQPVSIVPASSYAGPRQ